MDPLRDESPGQMGDGHPAWATAAMMAACCLALMLVFALIPLLGWAAGSILGAGGIIAMLVLHSRFTGEHAAH